MNKITIILIALLSASAGYGSPDIGNEVIDENDQPRSIAVTPCDLSMSWADYKLYQSKKNPEFDKFFAFVKKTYAYIYDRVEAHAVNSIVCETSQNLSSNSGYLQDTSESAKKRIALWKPEGEVSKDLLLIDSKKFYNKKVTDLGRAVTLFREFLHPAFFRGFGEDPDQAEWAKHNLVNSFFQLYVGNKQYSVESLLDLIIRYRLYPRHAYDYTTSVANYLDLIFNTCKSKEECQNLLFVFSKIPDTLISYRFFNYSEHSSEIEKISNITFLDAVLIAITRINYSIKNRSAIFFSIENTFKISQMIMPYSAKVKVNIEKYTNSIVNQFFIHSFILYSKGRVEDSKKMISFLDDKFQYTINSVDLCNGSLKLSSDGVLCLPANSNNLNKKIEFMEEVVLKSDINNFIKLGSSNRSVDLKYAIFSNNPTLVTILETNVGEDLVNNTDIVEALRVKLPSNKKFLKMHPHLYISLARNISMLVEKGWLTENRAGNGKIDFLKLLKYYPETKVSGKKLKNIIRGKE